MLVIIGGGRAGSYHARQLLKAVRSGRLAGERLLVVDRTSSCPAARELGGEAEVSFAWSDWSRFLRHWLATAPASDHLVPAPVAPHLLWEWLAAELRAERSEPPRGWGLPYEQPGPGKELFLSAAGWTCPATCVEPAHCPALHAPRDWDLGDLIEARARDLGVRAAVFRCLHLANGIAAIRVGEIQGARDLLAGRCGEPSAGRRSDRVLVATTSRCHAALGALTLPGVG
jgi:hypothetical protein